MDFGMFHSPVDTFSNNNKNAADMIDHNYFTGVLETPDQESMINLSLKKLSIKIREILNNVDD